MAGRRSSLALTLLYINLNDTAMSRIQSADTSMEDPFNQGAHMTEIDFENLMDQGSVDPTLFPSEWLEEYKQRKMEREAEGDPFGVRS